MPRKKLVAESELAALAKRFRLQSGKKKIEVAREFGVGRATVQLAEDYPDQSLSALRIRMIERYSPYNVVGPVYLLQKK
jgi:hypothetical protein